MKVRLKSFGLVPAFSENMPSGIVPKPPKPGFVSFGAIDLGDYWKIYVEMVMKGVGDWILLMRNSLKVRISQ